MRVGKINYLSPEGEQTMKTMCYGLKGQPGCEKVCPLFFDLFPEPTAASCKLVRPEFQAGCKSRNFRCPHVKLNSAKQPVFTDQCASTSYEMYNDTVCVAARKAAKKNLMVLYIVIPIVCILIITILVCCWCKKRSAGYQKQEGKSEWKDPE